MQHFYTFIIYLKYKNPLSNAGKKLMYTCLDLFFFIADRFSIVSSTLGIAHYIPFSDSYRSIAFPPFTSE